MLPLQHWVDTKGLEFYFQYMEFLVFWRSRSVMNCLMRLTFMFQFFPSPILLQYDKLPLRALCSQLMQTKFLILLMKFFTSEQLTNILVQFSHLIQRHHSPSQGSLLKTLVLNTRMMDFFLKLMNRYF